MSEATSRAGAPERRRNPELRALIEEMLERVREVHRQANLWSPEERARAEAALEQIMSRVRSEATTTGNTSAAAGSSGSAGEER